MALVRADLVVRGGPIWCGLAEGRQEALAVWGGRVLAAGAAGDVEPLIGPGTRVIELAGRAAIPAFNDAHLHLLPLGLGLRELSLRPGEVATLDGLLARVAERAAATAPGEWLLGRGYDHTRLDVRRHPTRAELDRVAPDHPVFLRRTCGHVGVANSKALALAGIDAGTNDPQGGAIERRDGELTGLLAERAMDLVDRAVPARTHAELVDAVEAAGRHCLSRGIASVMEAALGMRDGFAEWLAYQDAKASGRLPVRVYQCLLGDPGGIFEQSVAAGLVPRSGDDMMRVGAVKLFTDGSAGASTAAMTAPYSGGGTGILCYADDALRERVREVHRHGYQLAVHAIGDAAIEQTLRAIEAAHADAPADGRRHRIEHAGFATPDQLARMVRLGMSTGTQPVFMYDFGDTYVEVLGEDRPSAAYPMRSWEQSGLHPAASSDCPVCDTDPFANLYAMLTRRTRGGRVLGGQEALSLEQALHCYTYNGAWAAHEEAIKGRLAPGQLADVAVLSRDVFAADADEIKEDTAVDLTIRGGEVVYERAGQGGQ